MPLLLPKETKTLLALKPTMSALPSPLTSPVNRGKLLLSVQPPTFFVNPGEEAIGAPKVPLLLPKETKTLLALKPTMSALPSPLTSPVNRGKLLLSVQPPTFFVNPGEEAIGAPKVPLLLPKETKTLLALKPTMSALPSPLTSPVNRGKLLLSVQPPTFFVNPGEEAIGAPKVPLLLPKETKTLLALKPTMSALPSPLTSPVNRGKLLLSVQPPLFFVKPGDELTVVL